MFIGEARSALDASRDNSATKNMERGGVAQAAVDSNVARAMSTKRSWYGVFVSAQSVTLHVCKIKCS